MVGLADTVAAMNRMHPNDRVYVTLLDHAAQAVVEGESAAGGSAFDGERSGAAEGGTEDAVDGRERGGGGVGGGGVCGEWIAGAESSGEVGRGAKIFEN